MYVSSSSSSSSSSRSICVFTKQHALPWERACSTGTWNVIASKSPTLLMTLCFLLSPLFIVLSSQINEDCNFTHETLVSLEMNNASVHLVFYPVEEAGGEPVELNRPICAAAGSSFLERRQILNWQTCLIYKLNLHWAVICSLQALYSC